MKAIIGGRQTGKTTALIRQSAEGWHYIVCHSQQEVHRIAREARQMGLDIPLPLSYSEFLDKRYFAKGCRGFLIDNVEKLLGHLTTVPVYAFTVGAEITEVLSGREELRR